MATLAELYRQFAFISAVLGGFAFTFLGVLLTIEKPSVMLDWALGLCMAGAICFLVCALGTAFSTAYLGTDAINAAILDNIKANRKFVSLIFLSGVGLLIAGIGCSGWIRSRLLGAVSSAMAVAGALAAARVMRAFIN